MTTSLRDHAPIGNHDLHVRGLSPADDLPAVALALAAEDWGDEADVADCTAERLRRFVGELANVLLLASVGGRAAGICFGSLQTRPYTAERSLYLDELTVAPAWRRQGIGRALLHAALEAAHRHGAVTAWLATEPDNVEAHGLYGSLDADRREVAVLYTYEVPPR